MSDVSNEIVTKISEAVREYGNQQMGIRPQRISIDVHNQSVIATLEGVSHPAEMNSAKEKWSREMIEKMYGELFNVSKPVLTSRIERLLGKRVDRSFFALEPQYGNAVIVLFLSGGLEHPQKIATLEEVIS